MKRKTNIFYLDNTDNSKFITFSNYTEYMTGNFLSVNTKMIITKFICLNLPFPADKFAANETLINFKKFLICYYENKLAYLRDNNITNIYPLKYLFDAISIFFEYGGTIPINYISEIVEQSYNGEYSDNICVVDLSKYRISNVNKCSTDSYVSKDKLYGWDDELDNTEYAELRSIYDDENIKYKSYINESESTGPEIEESVKSGNNSLTFNCVIPMFRKTGININESQNNDYSDDKKENFDIDINIDIPFGIWFNEVSDPDVNSTIKPINLYKTGKYSQSWSLVICSKFSSFPFGIKTVNNVNSTENEEHKTLAEQLHYKTYADVISQQSKLLNKISDLIKENLSLKDSIRNINEKINNIKILESQQTIINYIDYKYKSDINELKEKINDLETKLNNFKWKYIN